MGGVPFVNYSTDEQVVGYWIDDKPIYQKSIVLKAAVNITTSWVNVLKMSDYGLEDIKDIIYGSTYRSNTYGYVGQFAYAVNSPYIQIQAAGTTWAMPKDSVITLFYTKTTD